MVPPKHNVAFSHTSNFAHNHKNCQLKGVVATSLVSLASKLVAMLMSKGACGKVLMEASMTLYLGGTVYSL